MASPQFAFDSSIATSRRQEIAERYVAILPRHHFMSRCDHKRTKIREMIWVTLCRMTQTKSVADDVDFTTGDIPHLGRQGFRPELR